MIKEKSNSNLLMVPLNRVYTIITCNLASQVPFACKVDRQISEHAKPTLSLCYFSLDVQVAGIPELSFDV